VSGGCVTATGERCPDCDCPNRNCACVLRARMEGAERRAREAQREAARLRELWQAAASCLSYNRARLTRPRGEDERRLLAYIEAQGSTEHGHYWSGKTDGWLDWLPAAAEPQPEQSSLNLGGDA
jgi:hypothetical protein